MVDLDAPFDGLEPLVNYFIIAIIIYVIIYVAQAIFLNKLNKLIYGKGTAMAWIPIANLYLLGKLTVNKIVGWILVICPFLTGTTTTTINGVETTSTFLPEKLNSIITTVHSFAVLALFAFAIIKYINLKKEVNNSSENEVEETQEPVTNTVAQPVQQPIEEPIQETIVQPTQQPVTNTVAQPVQQPIEQPIQETIAQPAQQPVTNTVVQPVQQPVQNPVNPDAANTTPLENNEQDPFAW